MPRKKHEPVIIDQGDITNATESQSALPKQSRISHANAFCAEALSVEANALKEKVGRVVEKMISDRESARDFVEIAGVLVGGLIALQNLYNTKPESKVWYALAAISVAAYGLLFFGLLIWKGVKFKKLKTLKHLTVDQMVEEIRAESKSLDDGN
jgi:hypothetical protein